MVLAILMREIVKIKAKNRLPHETSTHPTIHLKKPILALAFSLILILGCLSANIALSNYYVYLAENEPDPAKALSYFNFALRLNPENPSAYFAKGMRLYGEKEMIESAPNLQKAIDLGLGTVISYSYLAESLEKSNKLDLAEKTMAECVRIFPHSVFARVRYALLLEQNGKNDLTQKELLVAEKFDKDQTRGWVNLIKYRSRKAYQLYQKNKEITQPSALKPRDANLQFLDKIEIPQTAKK
jgi:tetratricopeptide (TPR) repeat protein